MPIDYFIAARQRSARRKSSWNLLMFLFAIAGIALSWIFLVRLLLLLRTSFFPENAFLMGGTRVGNILMYVAPLFPSIAAGFLFANNCIWQIPPARRALEEEARSISGADFKSSNKILAKGLLVCSFIALPVAILGSTSCFYLTESTIAYRATLLHGAQRYPWSELGTVETACWRTKDLWEYSYTLVMKDGTKVELTQFPKDFVPAYPILGRMLARQSYDFDSHGVNPRCEPYPPAMRLILTSSSPILEKTE